jgi:hypothetical protein
VKAEGEDESIRHVLIFPKAVAVGRVVGVEERVTQSRPIDRSFPLLGFPLASFSHSLIRFPLSLLLHFLSRYSSRTTVVTCSTPARAPCLEDHPVLCAACLLCYSGRKGDALSNIVHMAYGPTHGFQTESRPGWLMVVVSGLCRKSRERRWPKVEL